jgi:hypothetical protein
MLNYQNLIAHDPTVYLTFVNSIGQSIDLVEHPIDGDSVEVIAVSHDLKLAAYTDFWETGDIDDVGGEYEVGFINGEIVHGLND